MINKSYDAPKFYKISFSSKENIYVLEINLDKLPSSGKKLFIEKKFSGCSKDKSNGSIFFIASPFEYFGSIPTIIKL